MMEQDEIGQATYRQHQSIIEGAVGNLRRAEPAVDGDKARAALTDLLAEPRRAKAAKATDAGGIPVAADPAAKKP